MQKEDIKIIKSPVGLPGRAIYNKFLEKLESNKPKIKNAITVWKHVILHLRLTVYLKHL